MFFRIYDKNLIQYYISIEKRNSGCYAKFMKSALRKLSNYIKNKRIEKVIDFFE